MTRSYIEHTAVVSSIQASTSFLNPVRKYARRKLGSPSHQGKQHTYTPPNEQSCERFIPMGDQMQRQSVLEFVRRAFPCTFSVPDFPFELRKWRPCGTA